MNATVSKTNRRLRVALVTTEALLWRGDKTVKPEKPPYIASGAGLANLVAYLHRQLLQWRIDCDVFMPHYQIPGISVPAEFKDVADLEIHLADQTEKVTLRSYSGKDAHIYAIGHPYFGSASAQLTLNFGLDSAPVQEYRSVTGLYENGPTRELDKSTVLSLGTVAALQHLKDKYDQRYDIVVACNDRTAPVCAHLAELKNFGASFKDVSTIQLLLSTKFQGLHDRELFHRTGFGWHHFNYKGVEYHGKICLLKAGLQFADLIAVLDQVTLDEMKRPKSEQEKEKETGMEAVISYHDSQKRVAVLCEKPVNPWPPRIETEEAPQWQEICRSLIGHFRRLTGRYFIGMHHAPQQPLHLSYPVLTFTERLRQVNPIFAQFYRGGDLTPGMRLLVRETLNYGGDYLFTGIKTLPEAYALLGDLKRVAKIGFDRIGKVTAQLNSFQPFNPQEVALLRPAKFTDLTALADFSVLVEEGRALLNKLVVVTLAAGPDPQFFDKGEQAFSTRALVKFDDTKSFLGVHADQIEKAERVNGVNIPWFTTVTTEDQPAMVRHVTKHLLPVTQSQIIEQELELPGFTQNFQLALDSSGKRIPFFPVGTSDLLNYLAKEQTLSSLRQQGKTICLFVPVGNVGWQLLSDVSLALLAFHQRHNQGITCQFVRRPKENGPLALEQKGKVFVAPSFALPEAFRKSAQTQGAPFFTGNMLLSLENLSELAAAAEAVSFLPKVKYYGTQTIIKASRPLETLTRLRWTECVIVPDNFIYPLNRNEMAAALNEHKQRST